MPNDNKKTEDQAILIRLFNNISHEKPEVSSIEGGGSNRRYYRMKTHDTGIVGVVDEDIKENETFINLGKYLRSCGVRVPEIMGFTKDFRAYIQEDLGEVSLFELLSQSQKMDYAKQALNDLVKIQSLPESQWDHIVGYGPFSERLVKWDLNYFKYDFLKPASIGFNEEKLEDDFDKLSETLTAKEMTEGLMYRDFQSRNIMVKNDHLWFIDFQGARKGPVVYDAVSFIWQARAPFSLEEREQLSLYYAHIASKRFNTGTEIVLKQMRWMQVFRILQVLGAYGFRGLIEKKSHFLQSISPAINILKYYEHQGMLDQLPEIKRIAKEIKTDDYIIEPSKKVVAEGKLVVTVYSFSYKKGYPDDKSGNGGGFMFDCRAIHNPGRYPEYKDKTGRDLEVIEFLGKTDEAQHFIKNAIDLVAPSIERYIQRGFTSLQVGFGCTGGQHRSVYCAEKFAHAIKEKYPEIDVVLTHREWNIKEKIKLS